MDYSSLKGAELVFIVIVIGWFYWSQRRSLDAARQAREDASKHDQDSTSAATGTDAGTGQSG